MVIDGDPRVNETEQVFLNYLEPPYREQRPRVVTHENGCRHWLVDPRRERQAALPPVESKSRKSRAIPGGYSRQRHGSRERCP